MHMLCGMKYGKEKGCAEGAENFWIMYLRRNCAEGAKKNWEKNFGPPLFDPQKILVPPFDPLKKFWGVWFPNIGYKSVWFGNKLTLSINHKMFRFLLEMVWQMFIINQNQKKKSGQQNIFPSFFET